MNSAPRPPSDDNSTAVFPYREISRFAIVSIVLGCVSLLGLLPIFQVFLTMAVFGIAAALMGLRATKLYPNEYSGRLLAGFGLAFCAAVLVGGVTVHAYIYLTEVPDGYLRVGFYELQQPSNGPDLPTKRAVELNGMQIFVKGYVHPASGGGKLRRLVLVPDLGTCCFGGQPRSSDMIDVTVVGGETVRGGLRKVKLAGKFMIQQGGSKQDFDNPVYYRLLASYAN